MKESGKIQELENQTKEDIIRHIASLAKTYVPEWKFDPVRPDAGSALALIFADQHFDTVRRYHFIPEKHRIGFFSQAGLDMLPASPAKGIVTFGLSSDEFGGSKIPKGSIVTGPGEEGGDVSYETIEDVEVIPAKLTTVLLVDGTSDLIEKKEWEKPFTPFCQEKKNLQEHVFYLCQNEVLAVKGEVEIILSIDPFNKRWIQTDCSWLLNKEELSIGYGTEDGFEEFAVRKMEDGKLILKKNAEQPDSFKSQIMGKEGYLVCCRYLKEWKREPFLAEQVRITARAWGKEPDFILTAAGEQINADVLLFDECPQIFSECYFGSAEVFGKSGAKIKMTFLLEYEKVPFNNSFETEKKWRVIMKRSDFKPDPEYDITVEQVVWEYFNGSGWSRLPLDIQYQSIFNGRDGRPGTQVELEFICPPDVPLLEWQAGPNRYIRVRVLRMNNLYKLKGFYITPVISDVRFGYSYEGNGKIPDFLAAENNLKQTVFPVRELERGEVCWELFCGNKEQARILYLGFHQTLAGGPVRIYISLEETIRDKLPHLRFEYAGKSGFMPLDAVDETEDLKKGGSLTFAGKTDFTQMTICNETAYWIRIIDENGGYKKRNGQQKLPKISGIYMNAAKIMAVEHQPEELFSIESKEENKICSLLGANVWKLSVWVNELASITPMEREELKKEGRIEETFGAEGQKTGIWVLWEETEDFCLSGPSDRHYKVERKEGTVLFSDGKYGAIPPGGTGKTVRIQYSCGGGQAGNQLPDSIIGINGSFGYVNKVTNPLVVCGGNNRETAAEALHRGKEAMHHGGRAVTARDFEALALEASRSVQKVKCYPGYNQRGEYEPGSMTLILLLKEYRNGNVYFESVKEEVRSYITCRMSGNEAALGHLYVAEPQFLELDCRIVGVVSEHGQIFEVQRSIGERLDKFMHPVKGNYNGSGWNIGFIPNETQVLNALKRIPNLRYIKELKMEAYIKNRQGRSQIPIFGGEREKAALKNSVLSSRFAVGLKGKNEVFVIVE